MTQPIDRETAIALAKEAGAYYAGTTNPGSVYMLSESDLVRFYGLAVAHSRKDAEPDAWLYKDESTFDGNKWNEKYTSTTSKQVALFKDKYATPLFTHPPEADKNVDKLTGCACRWDEKDNRVATCLRHQGWLDVVEEWADRAKENQAVIDRLTAAQPEPNPDGTDYVSDREFDALISELQSITEEARATDYHDTLRKAALFLNLLRASAIRFARDVVRLDAACTEQHAAYTSAHNRLNEADKLLQQAQEIIDLRRNTGVSPTYDKGADSLIREIRTYLESKG